MPNLTLSQPDLTDDAARDTSPVVAPRRPARRAAPRRVAPRDADRRLERASRCASALRFGLRDLTLGALARAVAELPVLVVYLRSLPRLRVELSDAPAGRLIASHLALSRWGIPRFQLAQGVLQLPSDAAVYARGRHRQALRTNVRRARGRGILCHRETLTDWAPADRRLAAVAPVERWWATNRHGVTVGEAWVTVDERCALLHSLGTSEPDVGWLLHAAIVRRLCAIDCRLLLTNSYDVPLMPPGHRYFQQRCGYTVARLRVASRRRSHARILLAAAGSLVIVAGIALAALADA